MSEETAETLDVKSLTFYECREVQVVEATELYEGYIEVETPDGLVSGEDCRVVKFNNNVYSVMSEDAFQAGYVMQVLKNLPEAEGKPADE